MSSRLLGLTIVGALISTEAMAQLPERLPPVDDPRSMREMIDPGLALVEWSAPVEWALPNSSGPGLAQTALAPELTGVAPPRPAARGGAQQIERVAYLSSESQSLPVQTGYSQPAPPIDGFGGPAGAPAPLPNYSIDPRAAATQSGRPLDLPDLEEFDYPLDRRRAMAGVYDNTSFLISAGVLEPLGGGFFGNRVDSGWGMALGFRRALFGRSGRTGAWFGELTGSFNQNGASGPGVLTPGAVADNTPGREALIQVPEAFTTQLRDLKRGSLNLGLGRYFAPRWGRAPGRTWQFMTHGGIQFGHANASYLNQPTATIDAVVADRIAGGSAPATVNLLYSFDNTDTFIGLYAGAGLTLNWYDVASWWGQWRHMSLGVELDYLNQWIDLDGYSDPDASPLVNLAPMVTFSLGW